MKNPARSDGGSAFVLTLILIVAIVALTIAGLKSATSGIRVSNNYQTGLQARLAAEAGAIHAQKVIDNHGVVRFDTDILPRWGDLFGDASRTVPGRVTASYTVSIAPDPWNPRQFLLLDAIGRGLGESERSVRIRLQARAAFSPGAIYLPGAAVDSRFNGFRFLVDGHDYKLDGSRNPAEDAPGISTRFEAPREAVIDSLSERQKDNVIGDGGIPSVEWSGGPSVERIVGEIVPSILNGGPVVQNPLITGNDRFGTIAAPQVTHFTGNVSIDGTMDGAGILIVDRGFKITGDVTFTGLILVRGTTEITTVSGNATVLGSLWTTDLRLAVAGSASVTYSTEALDLASGVFGGEVLPQRVKAVAWDET